VTGSDAVLGNFLKIIFIRDFLKSASPSVTRHLLIGTRKQLAFLANVKTRKMIQQAILTDASDPLPSANAKIITDGKLLRSSQNGIMETSWRHEA
jgi:hypothetical protein